jgi:serine/threonine protein kinase
MNQLLASASTAPPDAPPAPASLLVGRVLDGGWTVVSRIDAGPAATGANFSFGYYVRRDDGTEGFLKALDFWPIWNRPDFMRDLQFLVEAYNFERDLLQMCRSRRMSRVVTALADGWVDVPGPYGPLGRVPYLIFEKAERDARAQLGVLNHLDLAWRVRALHHVANGVRQLHSGKIAHQDLKPSNILVFGRSGSRIADLGRAAVEGRPSPYDGEPFPGDPVYQPIECLYQYYDSDWRRRRFGTDLYMLGSLAVFFFTQSVLTADIVAALAPDHQPRNWPGDYGSVLPYVRDSFDRVCVMFESEVAALDPAIATEMTDIVRYLCDPDPARRGHPSNLRAVNTQHFLERFVTRFNVIASRVELRLRSR